MTQYYDVKPLKVGAEIHNLDLTKLDDADLRRGLNEEWWRYGVLIFRNTPVDNRQHIELSRVFGDLEQHPLPEMRNEEEPLMMQLGGKKASKAFVYDGTDVRVDRVAWHRDTAYTVDICKGALARLVERPPEEGFTLLADTAMAYDALSDEMKARIDGLEFKATLVLDALKMKRGMIWNSVRVATEEEAPGACAHNVPLDAIARYPSVVHPLVATHPDSGRKCIFISPYYLDEVLGLPKDESEELLDFMVAHTTSPEFVHRHEWQDNDLVLWDNRRMMHAATGYDPKYRRLLMRTTFSGAMNTGRLYDPNAKAAKAELVD